MAGRFRRPIIAADSLDDAAAMIQVQISGNGASRLANEKGQCLLALLESLFGAMGVLPREIVTSDRTYTPAARATKSG